jgi:hypothetical protein
MDCCALINGEREVAGGGVPCICGSAARVTSAGVPRGRRPRASPVTPQRSACARPHRRACADTQAASLAAARWLTARPSAGGPDTAAMSKQIPDSGAVIGMDEGRWIRRAHKECQGVRRERAGEGRWWESWSTAAGVHLCAQINWSLRFTNGPYWAARPICTPGCRRASHQPSNTVDAEPICPRARPTRQFRSPAPRAHTASPLARPPRTQWSGFRRA